MVWTSIHQYEWPLPRVYIYILSVDTWTTLGGRTTPLPPLFGNYNNKKFYLIHVIPKRKEKKKRKMNGMFSLLQLRLSLSLSLQPLFHFIHLIGEKISSIIFVDVPLDLSHSSHRRLTVTVVSSSHSPRRLLVPSLSPLETS